MMRSDLSCGPILIFLDDFNASRRFVRVMTATSCKLRIWVRDRKVQSKRGE
jgi:hypothetical protein